MPSSSYLHKGGNIKKLDSKGNENISIVYRILNVIPTTGYLRNGILHVTPGRWNNIAFHTCMLPFKKVGATSTQCIRRLTFGGSAQRSQRDLAPVPTNSVEHVPHAWKTYPRWKDMAALGGTQTSRVSS
ncbi:hypothetical protein MGYG_01742 [Nannizzia gypsea CBS 118893]|uniref:Uncharacterized protein n=1 Tax=Arthroderma gypseum (strain ATCC MYA-4604 / CBS 118893) TaxID=535722 RepID=E5R320_ARTGP|nr:hypothetical protein MGYG_01742 [Nannizzia gypsea CBS 118893]EFQ98724.1 hypothetical protein MGYG_01742 [Nannizzia gypsea CBS 118893]